MDFPDVDLDAPKRAPGNPNPRTRTLGLTPSIFFRVEPHKTPKRVSLATPKIFVCRVGAKSPQDIDRDARGERRRIKKVGVISKDDK